MSGEGLPRPVEPLVRPPDATVTVPGSKSLTNRSLLCAARAEGATTLPGALRADDTEAMADCLTRLGAEVRWAADGASVRGRPSLAAGEVALDARLSGTTSRFLLPFLATGPGRYLLDGAPPLRARPFGPLVAALRALGASIDEQGEPGCLPLAVQGRRLPGGRVEVPGEATSQLISGLLLAGPTFAEGLRLEVVGPMVSAPYVAMTVDVMRAFGVAADGLAVLPGQYRSPGTFTIEPDASSASYFFAAAAVTGGRVTVAGLDRSSRQGDLRFADEVLGPMGCAVEITDRATTVTGPPPGQKLTGGTFDLSALPDMAQTLAAVAVFAAAPTTIEGIGVIRGHETDRIAAVAAELRRCGIAADEGPTSLTVHPGAPRPAVIQTYDDHRMAMAFSVIGLAAPGIAIADPACVAKTFPSFFEALDQLR